MAVRDRLRDIEIEAGDHGKVGERRALHHDRIDGVQHQRGRTMPRAVISCSIHAVATPPLAASSTSTRPT